jgi:hypothetical protein
MENVNVIMEKNLKMEDVKVEKIKHVKEEK